MHDARLSQGELSRLDCAPLPLRPTVKAYWHGMVWCGQVLGPTARVGFTSAPAWIAFSPVKNNITDAAKAAAG